MIAAERTGCRVVGELIPPVAGGQASAAERTAVYLHAAACARCRNDLASALALATRLQAELLALPERPPGGWDRLAPRLDGPSTGGAVRLLRRLVPWLAAAGAPAAVCGLTEWALYLSGE